LCKLFAAVTLPQSDSHLAIRDATPGIAVVVLGGRVDAASVRLQRDQLQALPDRGIYRVVLDLDGVTFLDSAGMAMLVGLLKRARAAGGDVRMVEPADDSVRHILQLTRLDLVFKMKESVEAALQDLA
jgi:anti-sigma B factor antagonist